jgi:hypothetical protein
MKRRDLISHQYLCRRARLLPRQCAGELKPLRETKLFSKKAGGQGAEQERCPPEFDHELTTINF